MKSPLTYEAAERLRKQVMVSEMPKLDGVCVISGRSETVGEEVCGSMVLDAFLGPGRMWGEKGWIWRRRLAPPTKLERSQITDIPGISNGDAVTWGHLQALGITEANG